MDIAYLVHGTTSGQVMPPLKAAWHSAGRPRLLCSNLPTRKAAKKAAITQGNTGTIRLAPARQATAGAASGIQPGYRHAVAIEHFARRRRE